MKNTMLAITLIAVLLLAACGTPQTNATTTAASSKCAPGDVIYDNDSDPDWEIDLDGDCEGDVEFEGNEKLTKKKPGVKPTATKTKTKPAAKPKSNSIKTKPAAKPKSKPLTKSNSTTKRSSTKKKW